MTSVRNVFVTTFPAHAPLAATRKRSVLPSLIAPSHAFDATFE